MTLGEKFQEAFAADARLAKALTKMGVNPKDAAHGFRAQNPFAVAVMLAMRGIRVLPSNRKKIPCLKGWTELG